MPHQTPLGTTLDFEYLVHHLYLENMDDEPVKVHLGDDVIQLNAFTALRMSLLAPIKRLKIIGSSRVSVRHD